MVTIRQTIFFNAANAETNMIQANSVIKFF